jgi:bifunctional non-homologous end joining protein LigD
MSASSKNQPVVVDGVQITHPAKIWWPDEGITKLDVVRFYVEIAPYVLPWLKDRLLTAERCTEGMRGPCFFQKNFEKGLPPGTPTFAVRAESTGKDVHYVVGGAKKTLLALVNLGCIAIHVMNCRTRSLHSADWLAFDLDPSSEKFADAVKAANVVAAVLAEYKLVSFPKTSGGRGLHIFVPLRAGHTQDQAREFALKVGYRAAERAPSLITMEMSKAARRGRVLVDAMRNGFAQTVVSPFSVRRRPKAPVSTPLAWDEVDPELDPADFNIRTLTHRLRQPDPWADFWKKRQSLPKSDEILRKSARAVK